MSKRPVTIIGRPWRRGALTFIAIALLTVNCGASPTGPSDSGTGGRTFFVSTAGSDSNPGTREEPWLRLWRHLAELRPGDTIYYRGGTYPERPIQITSGGTASSPITIAGFEEEEVIIHGFPGFAFLFSFGEATGYVVLERLIIDSRGETGSDAVIVLAPSSHHIRFKQVEVRNGLNHGIFGGGTDHEFIDLKVHGNGLSDFQNSHGIYLTADNSTIVGGEFYDNNCYGVQILDSSATGAANNNTVIGATFYGNGRAVGLGGRSRCVSSGGGLVLGDVNNRADRNLVYQNLEGITVFGFKPSNGMKIFSNTVRDNIGIGIEIQRGAVNAEVRNNDLSGNGTGIVNSGTATILSNNGPQ